MPLDGSTKARPLVAAQPMTLPSAQPPANMHWVQGPAGVASTSPAPKVVLASAQQDTMPTASLPAAKVKTPDIAPPPHTGWMIQIGAADDQTKATELLNRAKSESKGILASASPFTEKVQKGDQTLYRARFAGLEADEAESACKRLKKSGFACFTTKN